MATCLSTAAPASRCRPAVNSAARKAKLLKEGESNLAGEYIREGLGMVVSVKVGAWMCGWLGACQWPGHGEHGFYRSTVARACPAHHWLACPSDTRACTPRPAPTPDPPHS